MRLLPPRRHFLPFTHPLRPRIRTTTTTSYLCLLLLYPPLPPPPPPPPSPRSILRVFPIVRISEIDAGRGTGYYVWHADDEEGDKERGTEEGGCEAGAWVEVGGHWVCVVLRGG